MERLYQLRVFTETYEKIRLFTSMEEARKEADRIMSIGEIAEKRVTGTIQTLVLCGKEYRHANEDIITFRNALSRNSVNSLLG